MTYESRNRDRNRRHTRHDRQRSRNQAGISIRRLAILVALAIILIGIREFLDPSAGAVGFGVPLLDQRDSDLLAIKAARDVASGMVVLALLSLNNRKALAYAIGALTLIPIFDGLIVFRHAAWTFTPVILIHWGTAAFMLAIVALLRSGR